MQNEIKQVKGHMTNNLITINSLNSSINNLPKIKNQNKNPKQMLNEQNIFYTSEVYKKYILNNNSDYFFSKMSLSKLFIHKIEYLNKLITSGKIIKYAQSITQKKDLFFYITKLSIYIIKNNINKKKHFINEIYLKCLIIMTYQNILPIDNFIFIIHIFLNEAINKIIEENIIVDSETSFNNSPLFFINDLFEALINIPRKLIVDDIHLKLINELIDIFDEGLFSYPVNFDLNKLGIWFKLLGNKIISHDIKYPLFYDKLIRFLVKIYKYNYQNLYYYKYFYEQSAISYDYYINSLDFLTELFKEEEKNKLDNIFRIKNGFYIYNNIPLTLNNIKLDLNSYSLIFSFKLTKIYNNNENIILFSLENEQQNIVLRFVINKTDRILKLFNNKNEWNTDIVIDINKDYLVCLSQDTSFMNKVTNLYIIDQKKIHNKSFGFPSFKNNMTLELGKSNFEGIFGEVLIFNKIFDDNSINHLSNLKHDYADIITPSNYKNDFTIKNKKYEKDNEDILFFKNNKCIFRILTYQINKLLNNTSSVQLKPYGELKYAKKIPNELNIRLYSLNFSNMNFAYQQGVEYLIFQLHKIISLSENDELLNYYLYKTLNFTLEYIKFAASYIFPTKDQIKFKVEVKFIIFVLSLVTLLNTKKRKLQLDENIRDVLFNLEVIYREKKAFLLQKMNFGLLLDNKIFKKPDITNYNKLFDEMILHLNYEGKENSLLYNEILYKFLLLDNILESKEIKHKKYMNILSYFLIGKKNSKVKDIKLMNKNFLRYFIDIKSPKKIYHYLKFMYYNIDSIKPNIKDNDEFISYIISNSNKVIKDNFKYYQYIQILCFLLNEIIIKNENEKNEKFNYVPYGFMKKPNYKFIKCIFIQYFNITNKKKLKFIKSSSPLDNQMELLKKISENKNFLSLFDFQNFIPRLNSIIKYYFFLYNEYLQTKNNNSFELLLKQSIKLILDFLDNISISDNEDIIKEKNNKSDDVILQNKNKDKNNKDGTSIKKPSKQDLIKKFINDLYSSSGIKLLFILYFNIYKEDEIKDLKVIEKYINISINRIYNPFYFYLLLPITNLNNNNKINIFYKTEILKKIINNIILINSNSFIKNNGSVNCNLVMNSIIVLIKIYHIINGDILPIDAQLEKNIIIFLKYILEYNYFYSKYSFDINLIDENVTKFEKINSYKNNSNKKDKKIKFNLEKEKKYNKLLPEIALDIIFHILEKKENPELITLLYNNLKLKENSSIFFKIDESFLLEGNDNKNQSLYQCNMIQLLNSPKINTDYCSGENMNNILYTLYFLIYFLFKQKSLVPILENEKEDKDKNQNELLNLINKAIELTFKDCINIFKIYLKKIKKNKTKFTSNDIIFKIYSTLFEQFSYKYKDNNFANLSQVKNINAYFLPFMQNKRLNKKSTHKSYLFFSAGCQPNLNDLSFSFSRSKMRKTTYIPEEQSNMKKIQNINKKEKTGLEFVRQRSKSQNVVQKTNKLKRNNDQDNNKKKESFDENILNNKKEEIMSSNNPSIIIKDNKKNLEISDISTTIYNNNDSDSDSDNYVYESLNYLSNCNCNKDIINNSINTIEEEKMTSTTKNTNKNSSSTNLRYNLLSPDKLAIDNENKNKTELKRKILKNLPVNLEKSLNSIDEEEKINEFNINDDFEEDHQFLKDKLNEIDIPNFYYKKIVVNNDPKWIRIIFNPKRALFKIFGFVFKNYVLNNRRFNKLKNTFNIKYKNVELEMSIPQEKNYNLKYPTKLKNFVCLDYYKPFLKPMINFFENEYFKCAHDYINDKVVQNDITEKDKFYKINYEKLILIIKDNKKSDQKTKVRCEHVTNKGSIFGSIYFSNELMIFKDKTDKDTREDNENKKTTDNKECLNELFFLFSSDISDRLVKTNKYLVIYYSEIKEIISRKFCYSEIAYEIFMRDGRAYYFNFFTNKNRKLFYDHLVNKINLINLKLKNDELEEKKTKTNIYCLYDHNYVDISFINEPSNEFQKSEYKIKYTKNEISNFQYLLLVNKYSSRTYNDCSQYLVFPLLFMDVNNTVKRDLSKPICLNKKDKCELDFSKYKNNYDTMGYHFNTHYASMAYVLYYLMRIIPFTFSQIKLQSGHFDVPSRMFTSLDSLLFVFSASDENRELVPEFFYSFESFLNLNYNNFGFTCGKQINHFNNNQKCGIVEFILKLREYLEKCEISSWINNIFGSNQYVDNYDLFNRFPDYSYEQANNFAKEKEELISEIGEDEMNNDLKKKIIEKIKGIKSRIQLLSLGITPSQLFKSSHPIKENSKRQNATTPKTEASNNNISKIGKILKKKKSNIIMLNKKVNEFINKNSFDNLLFMFNNYDNNNLKLLFLFKNSLVLFNLVLENEKDSSKIQIDLEEELKIIEIKPYKNIFVELYDKIFLLCRLINKTLLLCSNNHKFYIEWPCVITAIEFYSHNEILSNSYNEIHLNKIIIGDEEGNLSLIEIETEYIEKKKEIKINELKNIIKRQKIFYSYINGILYNKRLNIIISSCNDGYITINNAFSFEFLNIIKIDNGPNILDYKLSEFDLLYIHTKYNNNDDKNDIYNFYCYTLNGIKVSELDTKKEYINFFVSNHGINVICKDGNIYEYKCANLEEIENNLNKEDIKDIKNKGEICYSLECPALKCIIIIFKKEIKIIRINNKV